MTQKELSKVVEKHKHWINQDVDGWETMRANLCKTNLYSAELRLADLRGANLYDADLRWAYLQFADLREANLRLADLRFADLRGANLQGTNLQSADLRGAELQGANLQGAILQGTDILVPLSCPSSGEFIAWKKVSGYIIKLKIPADAKRTSATSSKCRCDKAFVEEIQNLDGSNSGLMEIVNEDYKDIIYRVGEMIYSDSFDEDRWNECSHGIHFFVDREGAVWY